MKKHWRSRSFIFSDEDVALFTGELKSKFPQLRILRFQYWQQQPGADPTLPYRPTLASAGHRFDQMQQVWLEPEGWRPMWLPADGIGYRGIANTPRVSFTWSAPRLYGGSWYDSEGRSTLDEGEVSAHYTEGDSEHLAFINSVWRTIAKLSTNKTPWCYHDLATGQIHGPFVAHSISPRPA